MVLGGDPVHALYSYTTAGKLVQNSGNTIFFILKAFFKFKSSFNTGKPDVVPVGIYRHCLNYLVLPTTLQHHGNKKDGKQNCH